MSTHDAPDPGLDIDSARIAADPDAGESHGEDVLRGGDPTRAPHSLTEPELRPIDGDSSGTGWDDPEEL